LSKREKIYTSGNYQYFAYFLRRVWKERSKILKTPICINYLVIIIIPKEIERIPINELVTTIKMGAEDFPKKIAEKSGIEVFVSLV
jgi:hypothetical protein